MAIAGFAILAIAWFALDIVWQNGLWGRLQATRVVYAGLSWEQRQSTVADVDIVAAAEKLRAMLRGEPEQSRILIYTGPERGYELLRFVWHLLPRNVALYGYARMFTDTLPEGCLLVFFRNDDWRTDPTWRRLLAHSDHLASATSIHGDSFEADDVVVFRFHHGR